MQMLKAFLPFAVQASLLLMVFAVGLQSSFSDLAYLTRHPRRLLSGLTAVDIVVPTVATVLIFFTPLPISARVAIALMAISPMAPLFPARALKEGAPHAYVTGLYAAIILLAVITVPLWVAIQTRIFHTGVSLSPLPVARLVMLTALAPLVLGLAVSRIIPAARGLARPINLLGNLILLALVVLILVKEGGEMLTFVGHGTLVAIALIVTSGILAGHFLGGPDLHERSALVSAATTRHPGIAGLIAHQSFPDSHVTLGILLFLLVGIVVSIPYEIMTRRAVR